MKVDIAVVGGGPSGLALAIHAARRGLAVRVYERRRYPLDKACGEGLLPKGLAALERLGVSLSDAEATRLEGVRYVQEDGHTVEARFRGAGGLGVRRTALAEVLRARAQSAGVEVHPGVAVRGLQRREAGVRLWTDAEEIEAQLVVAADGLASPIRRQEGLEAASSRMPRRYGVRCHFQVAPWTHFVEVHFGPGAEAYVTPVGTKCVGVALLFERTAKPVSFAELLAQFPHVTKRLQGSLPDNAPLGAGPLWQAARSRVLDRLVLLGDAGGYVDALSGEGLSLSLQAAEVLGALLPTALASGASRRSLLPYERACLRAFRGYERLTRALLFMARRPPIRRRALEFLARHPRALQTIVDHAVG
nr:kynurenine 3-monooxygenase [uncultured bacterium]